jgi:hypothetical protein
MSYHPSTHDQRFIDDCNLVILPLEMTRTLDVHRFAIRRALANPRYYQGLPVYQRAGLVARAHELGMTDAAAQLHALNQQALLDGSAVPHPATSPTLCLPEVVPRVSTGLLAGCLLALTGVIIIFIIQKVMLS